MKVAYIYCPYCGTEETNVTVKLGGNYGNGRHIICNECEEETREFELDVKEDTEDTEEN